MATEADNRLARVESVEMHRAVCGSWSSPWMESKSEAERLARLHDEFMGHVVSAKDHSS